MPDSILEKLNAIRDDLNAILMADTSSMDVKVLNYIQEALYSVEDAINDDNNSDN